VFGSRSFVFGSRSFVFGSRSFVFGSRSSSARVLVVVGVVATRVATS